ncbi:LiaI-LiaF-like domain-containing protein [Mucilaginibacter sp.]|uniref:LiaI-LiaF-like domain-containing protein n=1 Tax=Mucilaginibacter sp. TaxID=1882438 RepID=UPI0035BBE552
MRSDKMIPGLILVAIGAIFLLNNYNVIDFHWGNLLRLWPIFLIMGGVNLVFANNRSTWATVLKLSVVVAGFALLIFAHVDNNYFFPRYSWNHNGWHHNDRDNDGSDDNDDDDDDDNGRDNNSRGIVKVEGSSTYSQPYTPAATSAILNISGGGTSYTLKDTTTELFSAVTREFYNKFQFEHSMNGNVPVLGLHMKKKNGNNFNWDSDKSNSADIKLNTRPEWEMNVDAGATKLDFDLSKLKIKQLKISGGAASFDIKMGQPLTTTNIDVSTGVSEVNIKVPTNAAVRIESNSGLSSTDYDGFVKNGDGTYQTAGFSTAPNKMYIHMKGGVSDFKVTRY